MFRMRRKKSAPEAAPVVEMTPEQLAVAREKREEAERGRRAYWEECNPLRRWLVTFRDGTTHVVTAHRCSSGDQFNMGKVLFLRKRYGVTGMYGRDVSEVVFSTPDELVRSVELLEDD